MASDEIPATSRQAGEENEAKTKPKYEAARAIGGGFGSPKPLYLQGSARFWTRGDGWSMRRGKLQNEATEEVTGGG